MNLNTLTPLYKPIPDAISRALDGTCFIARGCAPTANGAGLRVDVAAGEHVEAGIRTTYAGGNVTLSAASSSVSLLYRRDIVYFNSAGTLTVGVGTPALLTSTTPVATTLPASATLVAICFVAPGQTVLVATDVEDCRQVRINDTQTVNVKIFGATGDGTTDDTTPFTNAFAALPAGGGTVYVPQGTYKVTASFDLGLLKSVVGQGRGVSIINYTGSSYAFNIGVPTQAGAPVKAGNRIEHLSITGAGPTTVGSIGIQVSKCLFPYINCVDILSIESGIIVNGSDLWVASGVIELVTMNEVKFGMLFTANVGKQVNHMTVVGGWIGGPAAAPANAYGVKLEASCDTCVFLGTATENYSGTSSKGFWVTSGATVGHRFYGTRTESNTTHFLLDTTATHHLVVGNSEPVTDNGYANQIIEMTSFRRSTRFVNYAASITPDAADGENKEIDTLTGNITIANPTNPKFGQRLNFMLLQDGSGGRIVTWGSKYKISTIVDLAPSARTSMSFNYNVNMDLWVEDGFGVHLQNRMLAPVGLYAANATDVTAFASNTSYFVYIGKAPTAIASLEMTHNVATAAVAAITWAEVGVFTGAVPANGNASLTRRGFTDVSATFNSTGRKKTAVTLSGVVAGDDLWLAFGSQCAVTMYQLRGLLPDDIQSGQVQTYAGRISTAALPVATTLAGATEIPPRVTAVLRQ